MSVVVRKRVESRAMGRGWSKLATGLTRHPGFAGDTLPLSSAFSMKTAKMCEGPDHMPTKPLARLCPPPSLVQSGTTPPVFGNLGRWLPGPNGLHCPLGSLSPCQPPCCPRGFQTDAWPSWSSWRRAQRRSELRAGRRRSHWAPAGSATLRKREVSAGRPSVWDTLAVACPKTFG